MASPPVTREPPDMPTAALPAAREQVGPTLVRRVYFDFADAGIVLAQARTVLHVWDVPTSSVRRVILALIVLIRTASAARSTRLVVELRRDVSGIEVSTTEHPIIHVLRDRHVLHTIARRVTVTPPDRFGQITTTVVIDA
jgi:hypothetical protein